MLEETKEEKIEKMEKTMKSLSFMKSNNNNNQVATDRVINMPDMKDYINDYNNKVVERLRLGENNLEKVTVEISPHDIVSIASPRKRELDNAELDSDPEDEPLINNNNALVAPSVTNKVQLRIVSKENFCNPYDSYYYYDYIKWTGTLPIFDSYEELLDTITPQLKRVAAIVVSSSALFYFKTDDNEEMFKIADDIDPHLTYSIKYKTGEKNNATNEPITKTTGIFVPLKFDKSFLKRAAVLKPYHKDEPLKDSSPEILNTFTGFKAQRVTYTEQDYETIKPFLTHIYAVWANANLEHFKFIITWLAHPIITLTKTGIGLVIIGEEGVGKSQLGIVLVRDIYGYKTASKCQGLGLLTQRFNSIIQDKMLIMVEEISSTDKQTNFRADFTVMKDLITGDKTPVERKYKDPILKDNICNFLIFSNEINPVHLGSKDRHYAIFEASEIVRNNRAYFDSMLPKFTEEHGNILYSYFRSPFFNNFITPLSNIPMTEIKSFNIETSRSLVSTFKDDLFKLSEKSLPEDIIQVVTDTKGEHGDMNKKYIFISVAKLHVIYLEWFKINHPKSKPCNDSQLSQSIVKSNKEHFSHFRKNNGTERSGIIIKETWHDKIIVTTKYPQQLITKDNVKTETQEITLTEFIMCKRTVDASYLK